MSATVPAFAGSMPLNCFDIKPAFKKESSTTAVVNADNYAFAETEIILVITLKKLPRQHVQMAWAFSYIFARQWIQKIKRYLERISIRCIEWLSLT